MDSKKWCTLFLDSLNSDVWRNYYPQICEKILARDSMTPLCVKDLSDSTNQMNYLILQECIPVGCILVLGDADPLDADPPCE